MTQASGQALAADLDPTKVGFSQPRKRRTKKSIPHTLKGAKAMLRGAALRMATELAEPGSDPSNDFDPAEAMELLEEIRTTAREQQDQIVRVLRSEPHCYSWGEIGAMVGISDDGAAKRWKHLPTVGGRKRGGQPGGLR